LAQGAESTLCNESRGRGGGGERGKGGRRSAQGEAKLDHLGPDPLAVGLVSHGATRVAAAEVSLHPIGWRKSVGPALVTPRGEIDGEDGQLAGNVRVERS
jgi:hypothetical protein